MLSVFILLSSSMMKSELLLLRNQLICDFLDFTDTSNKTWNEKDWNCQTRSGAEHTSFVRFETHLHCMAINPIKEFDTFQSKNSSTIKLIETYDGGDGQRELEIVSCYGNKSLKEQQVDA